MATTTAASQPLLDERAPSSTARSVKKYGCIACGSVCGLYMCITIIVQIVMYTWACYKCGPKHLKGYNFPGGGVHALTPQDALLVEQEPSHWGESFTVWPAKDELKTGASVGLYYRTWGPWFWTYTYQDVLGYETFVVRDRPLSIGGSHKIMRCDGQGPTYVYSEGGHWFINRVRYLFGLYTSSTYNIWEGSKLIGVSERAGGIGPSGKHMQLIFRDPDTPSPFGSGSLVTRNHHGEDEWYVSGDADMPLPNYVMNAATALMAFHMADTKDKTVHYHRHHVADDTADAPDFFLSRPGMQRNSTAAKAAAPAQSAEVSEPAEASQASEGAAPAQPTEVSELEEASQASEASEPAGASQPEEVAAPTQPEEVSEQAEASQSSEASAPAGASQRAEVARTVEAGFV